MKLVLKRAVGFVLIGMAVAGMLLSLAGLVGVWRIKQPVMANLIAGLELTATTLATTAQGLDVVDQSLEAAAANVTALDATVLTLAKSISDTVPLVDSLATLTGKDLPTTVIATQTSLVTAQSSARIIDGVLRVVTSIPFFPGEPYNPSVPLHAALGEVSASLDGLSESFASMESSLEMTSDNLDLIEFEVNLVATEIRQINTSLEEAQKVASQYQALIARLQAQVEQIEAALPGWINLLAWVISIILVWVGVIQIGLLMQGLELIV
ncbi:MAG: hypothetical protein FJ014_08965 [Chloroflexi bacterium]|nr:hypothetical protein [Chloroflexota bacterium]